MSMRAGAHHDSLPAGSPFTENTEASQPGPAVPEGSDSHVTAAAGSFWLHEDRRPPQENKPSGKEKAHEVADQPS